MTMLTIKARIAAGTTRATTAVAGVAVATTVRIPPWH
jgi:hypothetical protein